MKKLLTFNNQRGIAPILILVAVVGVLAFLFLTSTADFKNGIFGGLFGKKSSNASGPGVAFVDSNNQPVTQISSANVKLQLTAPWPTAGSASNFELIPDANAQTGTSNTVLTVASPVDDVNQDGNALDTASGSLWVGNSTPGKASFTGIRFQNVQIPQGAKIISSNLEVTANSTQWQSIKFDMAAENVSNSTGFTSSSLPSSRTLTTQKVPHSSNVQWNKDTSYKLENIATVVQEVVNRSDWKAGNNLSLIFKGTGSGWGRKFVYSLEGSSAKAPKLYISYQGSGGSPAPSASTAVSPKPSATAIATPTPTPTPSPKVVSAVVAEDAAFTKNLRNINPYTTNPTTIDYIFSDAAAGTKTVYVKFTSSTGQEQTYSSSVPLVVPSPSPTLPPSMPPMGNGTTAASFGIWNPNTKFDTCPSYPSGITTDQQKIDYIKSVHDSFKVKGPDGKWYPTWHPAVDPKTGCKFGHEHGQDPSTSPIYSEIKDHYAYVDPATGVKDLANAGLPFGYVNEQMDNWLTLNGNSSMIMRHEDHVGHKVSLATNFQIGLNKNDGSGKFYYPGVTCNYIIKFHQGVHSKDAFENNLHEVLYNVECTDGHRLNFDTMGKFGAAGEFTRSCDSLSDRTSIIKTGFSYSNANYPGTENDGARGISDRSCIEAGFLVPQGQFSQNPYEFWPVQLALTQKNGSPVVDYLNLLFDVEDSIRYYYPGHIDPVTGLVDNTGHMQDLCYENFNGRTFRGGICDGSTNYGAIKGITWDDPRAGFKGVNRGTYFKPGGTHNANGPTDWYSDPFGNNAQTTPFPGSVKQYVGKDTINYGIKANAFEDANVINMVQSDGNGTVHAPN